MDPHSPTGAGGGCKRAGATGTRRLCEAPGGPSFSEKAKNRESRVVGGTEQRKGAQVVPPALLQASVRGNPGRRGMGECRRKTNFGAGKQQHRGRGIRRNQDVGEGKGTGGTEGRGAGSVGPREAQAGLIIYSGKT